MTTAQLPIGQVVRVAGMRGTFRVLGYAPDGSVTLWGGPKGYEATRNAVATKVRRCRKAGPERVEAMAAPTRRAGRR